MQQSIGTSGGSGAILVETAGIGERGVVGEFSWGGSMVGVRAKASTSDQTGAGVSVRLSRKRARAAAPAGVRAGVIAGFRTIAMSLFSATRGARAGAIAWAGAIVKT
jgi:hypothetical protein